MRCKNSDNKVINSGTVEKLNNTETKEKISTDLLNDLKKIDNNYSELKVESLPKAEKAKFMDDLANQYTKLLDKSYDSISDLNDNKEKADTEKQNALNNLQKAFDDIELYYKKVGGGSGLSTDISYAKMNAARKEVCNVLKTYLGCSDDDLIRKKVNDDVVQNINNSNSDSDIPDQMKTDLILDYRVALNSYISADPPIYWNSYAIYRIKPIKCDEAYYVGCTGYPYVFRFEYNKNDKEARVIKRIEKDSDFEYLDN